MNSLNPIVLFIIFIIIITVPYHVSRCLERRKKEIKWKQNPRVNLDKNIIYLDNKYKNLDGPFYKEGKYWILKNTYSDTNYYACSESKSVMRFMARLFNKQGYYGNQIYSSDKPVERLIHDHAQAKRYVNDRHVVYWD